MRRCFRELGKGLGAGQLGTCIPICLGCRRCLGKDWEAETTQLSVSLLGGRGVWEDVQMRGTLGPALGPG